MNLETNMIMSTPREVGMTGEGLGFDRLVPQGGYRWWYVDGLSDCGEFGVTVIAFIGSVFSPYYFRARSLGDPSPSDHVCLNIVLYGSRNARWCMTERGERSLHQHSKTLTLGPSQMATSETGLIISIDERTTPFMQSVFGQIEISLGTRFDQCFGLDNKGDHWWWPIAPMGRIKVSLLKPFFSWEGTGYVDSNYGISPIENAFSSWNWARGHSSNRQCEIHYDAQLRDGGGKRLSLSIDSEGLMKRTDSPEKVNLPVGPIWRVARPALIGSVDNSCIHTLEDTPFYTRSKILPKKDGCGSKFMHESLDLDRFCRPWVQMLLPFRMPRRP